MNEPSKSKAEMSYGHFVDERCPNCGKFVNREDAFFDRKDRDDDGSEVLRFCDSRCADNWPKHKKMPEWMQQDNIRRVIRSLSP